MWQLTANRIEQVRDWIESTPHHMAEKVPEEGPTKFMVLTGRYARLRIPFSLLQYCFMRPGDEFDTRMYRWDFEAEKAATEFDAQELDLSQLGCFGDG